MNTDKQIRSVKAIKVSKFVNYQIFLSFVSLN